MPKSSFITRLIPTVLQPLFARAVDTAGRGAVYVSDTFAFRIRRIQRRHERLRHRVGMLVDEVGGIGIDDFLLHVLPSIHLPFLQLCMNGHCIMDLLYTYSI